MVNAIRNKSDGKSGRSMGLRLSVILMFNLFTLHVDGVDTSDAPLGEETSHNHVPTQPQRTGLEIPEEPKDIPTFGSPENGETSPEPSVLGESATQPGVSPSAEKPDPNLPSTKDCANSRAVGLTCSEKKTVETAAVISTAMDQFGSAAFESSSRNNRDQLIQSGGGQADAMDAAASDLKNSANTKKTTGFLELALTAWQGMAWNSAKEKADESNGAYDERSEIKDSGSATAPSFVVNSQDVLLGKAVDYAYPNRNTTASAAKSATGTILSGAAAEQQENSENAMNGMIASGTRAMKDFKLANDQSKAASNLRDAADKLRREWQPFKPKTGDPLPPGSPDEGGRGGVTPFDVNPVVTAEGAKDNGPALAKDVVSGDLGAGLPLDEPPAVGDGPVPSPFVAAEPSGGGGSGGYAGMSGGTSAAQAEPEPEARYAGAGNENISYEGASGGYRGGGARGGATGEMSLTDLLKSLIPQEKEFGADPKGGVTEFESRKLASGDESLLGRDVNLFERVHEAYQKKHRARAVGI